MDHSQDVAHDTSIHKPPTPRVSIGAYIMAIISGVFVAFGFTIVVALSYLIVGDWMPHAPRIVILAIPWVAVGLGLFAAWRSIVYARKAIAKSSRAGTYDSDEPQTSGDIPPHQVKNPYRPPQAD